MVNVSKERYAENPSRWPPAEDDNREAMVPFYTPAEQAAEQRERLENSILDVIAKVFKLDLRAIKQANQIETGRYRLGIAGFQAAIHPAFPAKLTLAKRARGKGDVFTLNRMLKDPLKFHLFSEFFKQLKVESTGRPVMLIGLHPRIAGYVAVTNLRLEPDLLCFGVCVMEGDQQHSIIFGEFYRILQAMRDQNVWLPQVNANITY
jgi:hypothetical protein